MNNIPILFPRFLPLLRRLLGWGIALAASSRLAIGTAFAQGGLERVNTFMENVLSALRGVSMAVVTLAIMWAGYKFLFKNADITECGRILAGGLLIGGAAELARYLLG